VAHLYFETLCESCEKQHTLFESSLNEGRDGERYSFTCPFTGRAVVQLLAGPTIAWLIPCDAVLATRLSG
jgi:hypothetical protein